MTGDPVERVQAADSAAWAPRVLVVEDSGLIVAKIVQILRRARYL